MAQEDAAPPAPSQRPRHVAILDTDVMVPSVQPSRGKYYSAQYIKLLTAAAGRLGLSGTDAVTFSTWDVVAAGARYPDPAAVDAVLVTGSIAAAYDTDPWVLRLGDFLREVYASHPRVRIFGTCFGHQLVGKVLLGPHGAVVEKDPKGYEFGVRTIELAPKLVEDFPCLGALGRAGNGEAAGARGLRLQMCHGDHVALPGALPGGWTSIGGSEHCRVQGLYEPGRVLTIQPHFECDPFIMEETIRHFYTPDKGFSAEFLQEAFEATRREDDAGVAAEMVLQFLMGVSG